MSALLLLFVQNEPGRIEVVLRDSVTRETVPGVPITLTASTGNEVRNPTTTVLTDPRGVAVFAALSPGAYFMKVDGTEFKPVSFNEYVLIEPGSQRRVEISVNQSATVTGRLLDTAGEPLQGSRISLLSTAYIGGKPVLRYSGVRRQQSGVDGTFRFTDVPLGDYFLHIDNSDALAKSRASDFARYVYYPAATSTSSASRIAVRAGEVSIGDIRIPDTKVFKVSGTVVNPFGGASASFYLVTPDTDPATEANLLLARFKESTNRNELSFEIGGLVPGKYVLYNIARSGPGPESDVVGRITVSIEDHDVEGIRIVASRTSEVRGRVVSDTLVSSQLENVRVSMSEKEVFPTVVSARSISTTYLIDGNGAFSVPAVLDGVRYGVRVIGTPPDAYVSDIRVANMSILNEGSFVARTANDPLEVRIASRGASFRGIVRDAANQPESKAIVVVVPDWTRRGNSLFYRRMPTDANGEFRFSGIAPGEYQLYAFGVAPPPGAEESADFMASYTGRGVTLRATAGATREASLRVIQ